MMPKFCRNLIIGRNRFVSSYGEYKQAVLSGSIALMGILVCCTYLLTHIFLDHREVIPLFATVILVLIFTLRLHRRGQHKMANLILLPTINIAIFVFASSEPPNTGTLIYFVSSAVAAFAVFPYRQRIFAIFIAILTYILFVTALMTDVSLLPYREYSSDMVLFNILINFSVALPVTVYGVYVLIDLNHYNAVQLVEKNEQLKKTNTELDRFVYSTSHDLRAPLSSILGLLNILDNAQKPEDQRKYHSMIKDRVHSLDKFIKDITDYSRNNRLEITHEKVKLSALADEVWESLKFSPEASPITFEIAIPDDITIDSDKSRLKVIISNLISNAIRYHDQSKERQFIRLSAEVNDAVFYLKVEDNGQGIAREYHTRIFDMFYRANEQSKGSGLGLYIVKEALMKLSGSISLESAPGVGSTFTVRLPHR
jgi:signal transduction histidine kinase